MNGQSHGSSAITRRRGGPRLQRHGLIGTTNGSRRTTRKDEEFAEAIFSGATPKELSDRFGQSEWTARAIIAGRRRPQIAARVTELCETFRVQTLARIETVQREALERVRRALDNPDDRVALKAARQAIRDWQGPFAAAKNAGHAVVTVNSQVFTITDAIRLLNGQTPAAALPIIDGQPARPLPIVDGDSTRPSTDSG